MARGPKYEGDLAKPMPLKPSKPDMPRPGEGGLLGDPRSEREKEAAKIAWAEWDSWHDEYERRLILLAKHYRIADKTNGLFGLLTALAETHVPGFRQRNRPSSTRSPGRPKVLESQKAKDARNALMWKVLERKGHNPRLSFDRVFDEFAGRRLNDLPPFYSERSKLRAATLKMHFNLARRELEEQQRKYLELAKALSTPGRPSDLFGGLFALGGLGLPGDPSGVSIAPGRGLLSGGHRQAPETKSKDKAG